MDIFIQHVPFQINHTELRLYLTEKLRKFDILAFDILKKLGKDFATLTVANADNGRKFLDQYGFGGTQQLQYGTTMLTCKLSNKRGQPEPLKVISLLQKEDAIRSKKNSQTSTVQTTRSAPSAFPVKAMMTGVWNYDHSGRLIFDQKFADLRPGSVTFGKYALVVYLKSVHHDEYNWHCRIDIPYAILEHTIPSLEEGNMGSIILTLKSPPKIYEITDTDNLHLYMDKQASTDMDDKDDTGDMDDIGDMNHMDDTDDINDMGDMNDMFNPDDMFNLDDMGDMLAMVAKLTLSLSDNAQRSAKLNRLCSLQRGKSRNSELCMVYKLLFPNSRLLRQAFMFVKDFAVPTAYCWKTIVPQERKQTIESDLSELEGALSDSGLQFAEQFQMQALISEGTVTPAKMKQIVFCISSMSRRYGSQITAAAIKAVGRQIPTPGPHVDSTDFNKNVLQQKLRTKILEIQEAELVCQNIHDKRKHHEHLVSSYKVIVTPTGMLLRGPELTVSNRILRKFAQQAEYFIRVSFADEDGLSVFYDPKALQDDVYDRFRVVLRNGISIAGRHFEFLGFSHSSLRCHETWFMAPFQQGDELIHAKNVIKDLGDFTNIHCSAKCAARIGQAFSDTLFSIPIPSTAHVLEAKEDVERNGRVFSDGCGSMSLELFQKVWKVLPPYHQQKQPTVLQIRYRGAKGMLSLDTSLLGEELHIRKSMTKYVAAEGWRDLELCGAAYRPLNVYLNHQFIKILEDLGVQRPKFLAVQNEACDTLEKMIKYPLDAANFLVRSHTAIYAKIPRLIELMHCIGLSFQSDRFLTDVIEVAAMSSLRDLKYRARILIEKGHLLYGIMDETNTLKEGEVCVITEGESPENKFLICDRVIVTRAPALHPGDIQILTAVDVPEESPLKSLHNCIVFSQQGARDLPSQLSGGDLDGDLFHIIYDERLMPDFTVPPADYAAVTPLDLGRSVEANDIADFFIDFMKMDNLGPLSNMHKIRADKHPDGTRSSDCIALAKLASDAVDFSKSGVPADFSKVPRGSDHIRPDFMSPGHNFVVNKLGTMNLEEIESDDIDDPDSLSKLDPDKSRFRFYRSDKVLGHLYRNIDEKKFFNQMEGEFEAMRRELGGESLLERLEVYIDRETSIIQWEHHTRFAEGLRQRYEQNMIDIMYTLRQHRGKPLTELEVFSGNILGKKERASTRYIREANQEVRMQFDRDVGGIVRDIIRGDEDVKGNDNTEALPRAIACFKVALNIEGWENEVKLKSWKYVAAAVCLEQLWKYQGARLRRL